jgi:hypothetical protein
MALLWDRIRALAARAYALVATVDRAPNRSLALLALVHAQRELEAGAREEPPGSNAGPWVHKYTEGGTGAWCAAFVSWCYLQAAGPTPLPFEVSRGAKRLYRRVGACGTFQGTPRPGDVVCWQRGARGSWKGHVGIVSRVDGEVFWSIEGNVGRVGQVAEFRHEVGEGRLIGFARV